MEDAPAPQKLPALLDQKLIAADANDPTVGLLDRFAFPPRNFNSPRIVRDDEIYWTRYYKLKDDASLAEIKVSFYDQAADDDGVQFAQDMKDYFEFKATLFPRYQKSYSVSNPPPLFDTIFEEQVAACFKSDDDIRAIIEDFKNVCKGNFFQKMCGKRFLQWICSAAYSAQTIVAALMFAVLASFSMIGAAVYNFYYILSMPTETTLYSIGIVGAAMVLLWLTRRIRNSIVSRLSAQIGRTQIQLLYWTDIKMMALELACLAPLLALPVFAPMVELPEWMSNYLSSEHVVAIAIGVVAFVTIGLLGKRLLRQADNYVAHPLDGMNEQLHKRFNDVTDSSAAFFVNSMQKRLHQLHLVTSHLDKRIDFEENLPGRGRQTWGARGKIWTKVIILAAKRVEYIEKHIQVEMWRVRMAHWSYHAVSDILANFVVPNISLIVGLIGVLMFWEFFLVWSLTWTTTPVHGLVALAIMPIVGLFSLLAAIILKLSLYQLRLLNVIMHPLSQWLSGLKSVDAIDLTGIEAVKLPGLITPKRLIRLFFMVPAAIACLAATVNWILGGSLLPVSVTELFAFGMVWFALLQFMNDVVVCVAREQTRTKGKWQTDINFLNSRIDSSKWEKFTDLRLPQLLGRQVERDKHKINELKSRQRPESER